MKKGILLGFRLGALVESGALNGLSFVDKDTYPARRFSASRSNWIASTAPNSSENNAKAFSSIASSRNVAMARSSGKAAGSGRNC